MSTRPLPQLPIVRPVQVIKVRVFDEKTYEEITIDRNEHTITKVEYHKIGAHNYQTIVYDSRYTEQNLLF